MAMDSALPWNERVAEVFRTEPRIAGDRSTIWLDRSVEQRHLSDVFGQRAVHVCIDGPTGAGKSSLALSLVTRKGVPYVLVQGTTNMEWPDFCRQLIEPPSNRESGVTEEVEFGVHNALPTGKLRTTLSEKHRPSDDVDLHQKLAESWTEHDVARRLVQLDAALIVDDIERISSSMLMRLGDLCKILTQTHIGPNAKLILVGTGDVYRRLFEANRSLDERLREISLGAFPEATDSWRFLTLGFTALGLKHPGQLHPGEEILSVCLRNVYEAADGLPKMLNRLGLDIALSVRNRAAVWPDDIISRSRIMATAHWQKYSREYPRVIDCLRTNDIAIEVVKWLYGEGMGKVHDVHRVIQCLVGRRTRRGHDMTAVSIDNAIDSLIRADFLVRTGMAGEVVFAAHPSSAHTLGVAMRRPHAFEGADALLDGLEQLELFPLELY